MKLFLTTYNVPIEKEHFFTKNVWKHLSANNKDFVLASILVDNTLPSPKITEERNNGRLYYKLYTPAEDIINEIKSFFEHINPVLIHSNMIEGYDVIAAKELNIPIVLTIHIGGFICPRGGGNGFLMYNDSICTSTVCRKCLRCSSKDLPFPNLSYLLYKIMPFDLLLRLSRLFDKRSIYYLSAFLHKVKAVEDRIKALKVFQYATVVCANSLLVDILQRNGLKNIALIPHGIEKRVKLVLPKVEGPIKFFYLGRIQYSKGLHILMKALNGLTGQYELHIIGDAGAARKEQRYEKRIRRMAKRYNVYFHGRIANAELETLVKDMHVMIHPAICLEVYGISIAEVLSMGRPVLATKCGGAEMQIQDNVNGWLIDANNVRQLHSKIQYIIDNPNEIVDFSKNCKLPHSIESYIDILNRILYQ